MDQQPSTQPSGWPGGWYVYADGRVDGPYTAEVAFAMDAQSGDGKPRLVSRKGFSQWYALKDLGEIFKMTGQMGRKVAEAALLSEAQLAAALKASAAWRTNEAPKVQAKRVETGVPAAAKAADATSPDATTIVKAALAGAAAPGATTMASKAPAAHSATMPEATTMAPKAAAAPSVSMPEAIKSAPSASVPEATKTAAAPPASVPDATTMASKPSTAPAPGKPFAVPTPEASASPAQVAPAASATPADAAPQRSSAATPAVVAEPQAASGAAPDRRVEAEAAAAASATAAKPKANKKPSRKQTKAAKAALAAGARAAKQAKADEARTAKQPPAATPAPGPAAAAAAAAARVAPLAKPATTATADKAAHRALMQEYFLAKGRLRLGKLRNPWLTAAVGFPCTLGILWLTWFLAAAREVTFHATGEEKKPGLPPLALALVPFVHIYMTYRLAQQIAEIEAQNRYKATSPAFAAALSLCPPLALGYLQANLNRHWLLHAKHSLLLARKAADGTPDAAPAPTAS